MGDKNMNELIKIEINENDEQVVSVRMLHEVLGIKERFSTWWETQVKRLGIKEFRDYCRYTYVASNNREYEDFYLNVEMGIHLCMISNGEKAHEIRDYFIEIHKKWNDPVMVMARANKIQQKVINDYKEKLLEYKPAVDLYNNLMESRDTLDMGKVAKTLNFKNVGRNKLFEILRNEEILQINNEPYQEYVNKGWFKTIPNTYIDHNNITHIKIKTVVYGKGLEGISKLLSKKRFIKNNENYNFSIN